MSVIIRHGDCREILKTLPDQSVHMCCTSPPYFGLRDYGTAKWDGGDADCDHLMPAAGVRNTGRDRAASGGKFHDSPIPNQIRQQFSGTCGKCNATRVDSQIGLEATPDAFVAEMVAVFAEVKRVLRDDGTLWLNLGDSYAGGGRGGGAEGSKQTTNVGALLGPKKAPDGYKAKDLMGIPWRVAFALQADGWYLRQDIIWSKPNPMPESVTDRCTKAHEYIFLLSKSARYFYDAAAVREEQSALTVAMYGHRDRGEQVREPDKYCKQAGRNDNGIARNVNEDGKRNLRSVWSVATQPFSEAHFATFPPDLIEPCIKAGCPAGGTVLDPFGGAGTTGLVADRLQRDAILIELNPEYAAMADRRIRGDGGMFAEVQL